MKKRGLTGVVETILLILLVIVAITILTGFLFPFVKDSLKSAGSCVNSFNAVQLNPAYTCYYTWILFSQTYEGILVGVETENVAPDSLVLSWNGGGESKNVEIKNGTTNPSIGVYRQPLGLSSPTLILPGLNEGKTYNIYFGQVGNASSRSPYYIGKVEQIKVAAKINGEQCQFTEPIYVEKCPSSYFT